MAEYLDITTDEGYTDEQMLPKDAGAAPITLPRDKADEVVGEALIAAGKSLEQLDAISGDLQAYGKSLELSQLQQVALQQRNQDIMNAAAMNVQEFGPEAMTQVAQQQINEPISPREEYLKNMRLRGDDSVTLFESLMEQEDREVEYTQEINSILAEASSDLGWNLDTAIDAVALLAPHVDYVLATKLGGFLEQYGYDHDNGLQELFATGESLNAYRDFFDTLPGEEQVQLMRDLSVWAKDNAGLFSGNEFLRIATMQHLAGKRIGTHDYDSVDWDAGLTTASSILDTFVGIGGIAKGVKALQITKRATLLDQTKRANADVGDELEVAAMSDTSGLTA